MDNLRFLSNPQQPDTTKVDVQPPTETTVIEPTEQVVTEPVAHKQTVKKSETINRQDTTKKEQATPVANTAIVSDTVKKTKETYNPWISIRELTHQGEAYLLNDTLIQTQSAESNTFGVTAKPAPYTISGDNIITGLLIASFIIALISVANSRRFIARQAKKFFRTPNDRTTPLTETTNEIRFQIFLVVLTCLLGAIIFFFYTLEYVTDTFVLSSQYQMVAIYFGIFVTYFLMKFILYAIVNWVFFNRQQNERWLKSQLFVGSMEGLLIFPAVLLLVYFDLSVKTTIIYALCVIIFIKILSFYKCYVIFFRKLSAFLQFFLYFCALEIIPIAILYGFLVLTNDFLRINY